jgi:putative ABC transport system permease protein
MDHLAFAYDLRHALRQIRRAPAFTFFVVTTLAVAIGANTTIFSAVNALLLRPLPWAESHRLVQLTGSYVGRGDDWSVSLPNALDWRRQNSSFAEIAYYQSASLSLTREGSPEQLRAQRTSANLFPLLGVGPQLGRGFTPEEDTPTGERVALLSYALWQRRFGGAADVVGRIISLSGNPHTIVGVMPESFSFPRPDVELWVPVRHDETTWARGNGGLQVLGRLNAGMTLEQAQRDMAAVSTRLAESYPATNAELSAHLTPLRQALYGNQLFVALYTLFAAVAFVLLIASVNVGNLMLARATTREREVAVRAALGAGRRRVAAQLLTESLVLASLGGAGGALLAVWGTRALAAAIPEGSAIPPDFAVDKVVLAFTAVLALLSGIGFGIAPAIKAAQPDLTQLLGGRSGSASNRQRARRRNLLVVAEVALATMLLVSASLMIRSLSGLLATDPGFRTSDVLTFRVSLGARYTQSAQIAGFQRQVEEHIRALPGVQGVGAVDWVPLGGTNNFNDFRFEESPAQQSAGTVIVTPGYHDAMGIQLIQGRGIEERDVRAGPGVVVINSTMARRFWPDRSALGTRIRIGMDDGDAEPYWRTVVGVVGDVRHSGLDEQPRAEMYVPLAQLRWPLSGMTFVVRAEQDPLALVEPLRQAVWSVDPEQPVYQVRTMERLVDESSAVLIARILAGALALFGAVALLLAALGLYGVISYSVAQRTYEIGVRCALGADRRRVLALVMTQGMSLVATGLVFGLIGAFSMTRLMKSILFTVGALDPISFIFSAGALAAVAAAATSIPALRAARIDPVMALRAE